MFMVSSFFRLHRSFIHIHTRFIQEAAMQNYVFMTDSDSDLPLELKQQYVHMCQDR